jgi:hypothetical protein
VLTPPTGYINADSHAEDNGNNDGHEGYPDV